MNFVTIHDLSRELNIPARVVRYRFHQLREAGKLNESADFRRDDFVDEQHFTWKINPLSYMRATATSVASPPLGYQIDNKFGNEPIPIVNEPDTKTAESVTKSTTSENQTDNQKGSKPDDTSLHREVIEFLKEQVRTKDDQIRTKDEQIKVIADQMKGINDLNIKLVGQNVHQAERIQDLLQLTTTATSHSDSVTKADDSMADFVNDSANQDSDFDTNLDASATNVGRHTDSATGGQGSRMTA